jgi:hypothetical protein
MLSVIPSNNCWQHPPPLFQTDPLPKGRAAVEAEETQDQAACYFRIITLDILPKYRQTYRNIGNQRTPCRFFLCPASAGKTLV